MTLRSLHVRGPFKGPSGYDHHVREFVRELDRQGIALQLADLPEWGPARLPEHMRDPWFDSLDKPVGARSVLHFCMPHQVIPYRRRINVNYTMFEATRIPTSWVMAHEKHDLVILPTESSRRAWIDSGVPEELIRLCPLGINPALFAHPPAPLPIEREGGESVASYRVRFLNVSELGPRKNLPGLLRAWLRATSRKDDAVLVMKVGNYAPGSLLLLTLQIEALQRQVGKRWEDAAPVHFVSDLLADEEMPRLYAAATHYISMSFGEGWDQTMVEAAASGLKLIAPNHSAYTAYLDPSVAQLVPSREVPAAFQGGGGVGSLFAGACCWEPDEDAAVEAIRSAIEGRDEDRRSARARVLSELTWERATRRLIAILSEVEGMKGRRRFRQLRRAYTTS